MRLKLLCYREEQAIPYTSYGINFYLQKWGFLFVIYYGKNRLWVHLMTVRPIHIILP
jgi:hypothetical protein